MRSVLTRVAHVKAKMYESRPSGLEMTCIHKAMVASGNNTRSRGTDVLSIPSSQKQKNDAVMTDHDVVVQN